MCVSIISSKPNSSFFIKFVTPGISSKSKYFVILGALRSIAKSIVFLPEIAKEDAKLIAVKVFPSLPKVEVIKTVLPILLLSNIKLILVLI